MKEVIKTIFIVAVHIITSFNFVEFVASTIGLNMIDVQFVSLTKEFIIFSRQPIQSSILFKHRYYPGIHKRSNIFIIARYILVYPFWFDNYNVIQFYFLLTTIHPDCSKYKLRRRSWKIGPIFRAYFFIKNQKQN